MRGEQSGHPGIGPTLHCPPWQTSARTTPLHLAQKLALALAGHALPPRAPGIPLEDGRRLSDPQNLPHSPSLHEGVDTHKSQGAFRTQLPESTPAPLLQPHTRPQGGGQGQKHTGGHHEAHYPAPWWAGPPDARVTGSAILQPEWGVGVCVGGTPAGTQCGVSSSSLAGSTPTPGQQKGDMCPLPRSEAKGAAWGRPDPYRLPDIQGDDATKQGRTHSTVGRGLVATQWTLMELVCQCWKGGMLRPTMWGQLSST